MRARWSWCVTAAAAVLASALGLGLRGRIVFAAAALALFAGLVGPEPSVLRASVTGLVGLMAVLASSTAEPVHTLCLAVIGLVLVDSNLAVSFGFALSVAAFNRVAQYDAAIGNYLSAITDATAEVPARAEFPAQMSTTFVKVMDLRYGENPHQQAAFYTDGSNRPGVATARQWQGKELSYNNINDTDAAFELAAEFPGDTPAVAIIKHANPCGVAQADTLEQAYRRAFDCDRTSAFGGIVALNGTLDEATARAIAEIFTEVVIAPDATDAARAVFAARKNLRLLTTGGMPDPRAGGLTFRQVAGGFLVQGRDNGHVGREDLRVVTQRQPSEAELSDLMFAWTVAKHVKSNAIVYARDGATVGIGAGQMSRVDSTRIGRRKSEDMAQALGLSAPLSEGAAVASDAFFPFADGIEALAEAGARAVIQPGGSMRDAEVIAAADRLGLAMVFTGQRHFRH